MTYLMRALGLPYALRPDDDAGSGAGGDGGDQGASGDSQGETSDAGSGTRDASAGGKGGGDEGKLTSENRSLRQRLRDAEAERDKLAAAQQTEAERLQGRAEKAEKATASLTGRIQTLELERAIAALRGDLGIVASPATCARLIDRSTIEWDDDHAPVEKSVSAALKALAKSDPALVRQGPGDAGAGRNGSGGKGGGGDMNALIRGAAGR